MRGAVRVLLVSAAVVGVVAAASETTTFNRDVAPILQQRCQECHRSGGSAPFPLLTHDQAYRRREKIREAITARKMPPWKPVDGYGDLLGARRLSAAEIETISRWVDAGGPEGDPRDLPPPRASETESRLGPPDFVLRPVDSFTVPARSGDVYRCFSVPTSFSEDRYFAAAEVVPENSRIVHHVLAMVDPQGSSVHMTARDGAPGYPCFGGPGVRIDGYLGGWAPGARPWVLPQGVGILLPAGARVVFQLHYHNARLTAETDRTELRLYASKARVATRLHFMRVGKFALSIPAGAARHEIEAGMFVDRPMRLIAIHPHMHLLGREMKVWARMPDETTRPLIHIDDWDFNWQGFYFYARPVALPVGAWIELTATWDNSADNPRNPHRPPQDIRWGERTVDEMGHAAILYTFED